MIQFSSFNFAHRHLLEKSLLRANKIIAESKAASQLDPGDWSTVNPMVWQLSKAGSEKAQVKVFAYFECLFLYLSL